MIDVNDLRKGITFVLDGTSLKSWIIHIIRPAAAMLPLKLKLEISEQVPLWKRLSNQATGFRM